MAESGFEKTEAPTPRKRQEARNDGNVAKSADLSAACILLATVIMLYVFGLKLITGMKMTVEALLGGSLSSNPTRPSDLTTIGAYTGKLVLEGMAPLALGMMAVALLASVSQVGLIITPKPLQPNLSRLSLIKGVQKLMDARAGMRLVMSLAKIAVIAGIAIIAIMQDLPRVLIIGTLDPLPLFAAACEVVYSVALKLAIGLLILALLDYAFQRWQHERDMRMTKQEVRDELKRMEGDPMVKQRRSRVARQLALQRINQAVPSADVVVTNPTHFAVALRYDSKTMVAPTVVAKGADYMAMRIRQVAAANGVPIVERKEIARALYQTVEPGQQVPPQFFSAVAEILAYVYRLQGRKSA